MPPFEVPSDFIDQFRTLRQQVADLAVKLASVRREVSGTVGTTGSESSDEFSVTKNGTGDYSVTFTVEFSSAPNVVVTARGVSPALYARHIAAVTTSGFRVAIGTDASVATDGEFHFIARQGA